VVVHCLWSTLWNTTDNMSNIDNISAAIHSRSGPEMRQTALSIAKESTIHGHNPPCGQGCGCCGLFRTNSTRRKVIHSLCGNLWANYIDVINSNRRPVKSTLSGALL
jgi:hypothetical protein